MNNLTVLNDLHIGAIRTGGTRPDTAYQLRKDLLSGLEELLSNIGPNTNLLINGDLCDGPAIPTGDLLQLFQILSAWLDWLPTHRENGPNEIVPRQLFLSNGNHDLSKNSTVLSSFQLLAKLLIEMHGPERVVHIEEGTLIDEGVYVIPHVANQDLFDLELAKVPECDYLFVHCNYDNEFAVEADHSLNLSKEWARKLPAKRIVFGHEHQARIELNGKVVIVGNQLPSSISDCLGNDIKCMLHVIDGPCALVIDGERSDVIEGYALYKTWKAEGDFSEQDWRDLKDEGRFIRATGTATAAEGAAVVQALSNFRKTAKALVITNAVKVEGTDDGEMIQLSHEQVQAFDVLSALLEVLSEEEGVKVTKLLEESYADQRP